MPRLCILTQYFPPEMGAPQARLSELGERLVDRGWDVDVLTALPNYPTGRILDGYSRRRPVTERIGRLPAARVPLWPSKSGFAKRLVTYHSFALSASLLGPVMLERPAALYVESPPLFIGFAARVLSRRWRCPFVLNVSDLWPESAVRMGVIDADSLPARWAERYELGLYRKSAGVTGQSDEIIESIRQRAPGVPTAVVSGGVDPTRFGRDVATDEGRRLLGSEPGPVFVFAGLLGLAQGLEAVVDAMLALPDTVPGRLVLVGEGPVRERLEAKLRERPSERVRLVGAVARDAVPGILASADAALVSLGHTIPGAVPSKIYEAMASELPILLVADGEAARRVEEAECGITVPPGDAPGIARAFTELASQSELRGRLGAASRRAAVTRYDRTVIAGHLDRFLREVALGE